MRRYKMGSFSGFFFGHSWLLFTWKPPCLLFCLVNSSDIYFIAALSPRRWIHFSYEHEDLSPSWGEGMNSPFFLRKKPKKLIPGITSHVQSWSFNSASTWSSTDCGRFHSDFLPRAPLAPNPCMLMHAVHVHVRTSVRRFVNAATFLDLTTVSHPV